MASIDDESTFDDPAEALRLIDLERANLERELAPDPRLMYWPWGLAWLIGSGLFFLRWGPDERVLVALPDWLPITVMTVLLMVAGTITGMLGARSSRAVRGLSTRQGQMFGFAWSAGIAGLVLVFSRLSDVVPVSRQGILWGGGLVALIGALYMAGAAIWDDRSTFVLGAWISGINIVGVLAGPGWHALIVAVAGGGGLLVAGLIGWSRRR
ncbi:transporter [Actinoplanes oblitus]|uniref:Transporter n=1 Tax=Actinoplanes oblitus TaxID=3040509 RepID=A0ABY8WGG9_9ACTN|nr:transporter [Actinoplanes oblitus]WIM96758.1 transporter [Actinoplanes oblitus]